MQCKKIDMFYVYRCICFLNTTVPFVIFKNIFLTTFSLCTWQQNHKALPFLSGPNQTDHQASSQQEKRENRSNCV